MSKNTGAYNIAPGIRLKVRWMLRRSGARHGISRRGTKYLRSAFPQRPSIPCTVIGAVPAVPLIQDDLGALAAAEQEREAARMRRARRVSADLATVPLARRGW